MKEKARNMYICVIMTACLATYTTAHGADIQHDLTSTPVCDRSLPGVVVTCTTIYSGTQRIMPDMTLAASPDQSLQCGVSNTLGSPPYPIRCSTDSSFITYRCSTPAAPPAPGVGTSVACNFGEYLQIPQGIYGDYVVQVCSAAHTECGNITGGYPASVRYIVNAFDPVTVCTHDFTPDNDKLLVFDAAAVYVEGSVGCEANMYCDHQNPKYIYGAGTQYTCAVGQTMTLTLNNSCPLPYETEAEKLVGTVTQQAPQPTPSPTPSGATKLVVPAAAVIALGCLCIAGIQ